MSKKHQKTNKAYVSPIQKHLAEFDRTHKKSASQQAEINKYKHIYQLRDHAVVEKKKKSLWDF